MPSGPGSIEGLGESFEPQLNSGTARYRVPLKSLPGRAGFAPQLALTYNSGLGNGPFGLGWAFDVPYIQRQTDKGIPYYTLWPDGNGQDDDLDGVVDNYDEFDTVIYSGGEELVPVTGGFWRLENEGEFVRFERTATGWEGRRRDGVVMRFGLDAASRVQSPTGLVFRWNVSQMVDLNGNTIDFEYEKYDGAAQSYLRRIVYNESAGGAAMVVELDYEGRPDVLTDFRPRFELKTAYRCKEIRMRMGQDPVRSYRLAYAQTGNQQPQSLLASVTPVGRDGSSTLPPASFSYTVFDAGQATVTELTGGPIIDLTDPDVDLIDLNADGLPDILDTNEISTRPHAYYLNKGTDQDGQIGWTPYEEMASGVGLSLGTASTRLADMNGDGRADLMDVGFTETYVYTIGNGIEWKAAPSITGAPFSMSDPGVSLLDVDGDKRIDAIQTASFDIFVWLNRGDNVWSGRYERASPNASLQIGSPETRLADMNGDRLLDLVFLQSETLVYYPSRGFGQYAAPVAFANAPVLSDLSRVILADVNGDGRADLGYFASAVSVWLNLGLDPVNHAEARFATPIVVPSDLLDGFSPYRQADMNGNGSTDLVWNTSSDFASTMAYLDFAPGEQPYQLKTITNGIGRVTTLNYRSSTADLVRDADAGGCWQTSPPPAICWQTQPPMPVSVLGSMTETDGLQTYSSTFAYRDGYYDGAERQFRGFGGASQREFGDATQPDLVTEFTFDTGVTEEALKGKLLAMAAKTLAGDTFHSETHTWDTRPVATPVAGETRSVTFAFESAATRTVSELGNGAPVSLAWDYDYDNFGNRTLMVEHGRLDAGWDDERRTVSSYSAGFASGQAAWVLDRLVEETTSDENGAVAAATRNFYDQSTTAGQVSQGNLTRVERWVSGGQWQVTTRSDYDAFGNIVTTYDGMHGSAPGHYRQFVYDPDFHTFPVQEIVHTGGPVSTLTMSATYDPGFGVMTSSTDFAGFTTSYGYDTFARLTAIVKPGDSAGSPTTEYGYALNQNVGGGRTVNWVDTHQRESAGGGTVDSRSFFDGLGRKIMTRAEGESAGQTVVSDTVQFNARKQPARKYLPYFDGGGLGFVEPSFSGSYTAHLYDALGREVRMTQPDGSFATTTYQPLRRIVQDEEQTNADSPHAGGSMQYVTDGLLDKDGAERLREVREPPGWTTRYTYDVLDNLTGYTDAQANQKSIAFDGLSRKTFMDDPDRGQWSYLYDDADNLIRTTDAKGQVIRYQYDGANRILAEFYGPQGSPADVEYHYDAPAGAQERGAYWAADGPQAIAQAVLSGEELQASFDRNEDGVVDAADVVHAARNTPSPTVQAQNTPGRLAWVRDLSGEEHTSYDNRGRVAWTIKRIKDEGGALKNFFTGMAYDSMDRMTTLTYPDQTTLAHQYNARGLPESMPGVVTELNYNPAGERLTLALANGVTTSYSYDTRLRLSRLHSVRSSDGLSLQDFAYTYDGVSNITRITDQRGNQALDTIGTELGITSEEARKFNGTQDFTYDAVYRLTQAKNDAIWGTLNWQYDAIGNMTRQDAALLTPDPQMQLGALSHGGGAGSSGRIGRAPGAPPGPHALTGTENAEFAAITYDATGNITTQNGATFTWDARHRLLSFDEGTVEAEYSYDFRDNRSYKRGLGVQETLYVDMYSELRNGALWKYVYSGTNRVARQEGRTSEVIPGSFYLHDHLGSTHVGLVGYASKVAEQSVFYPYGSTRTMRGNSNPLASSYKFAGKERDDESKLDYLGARYLNSATGAFMSVDDFLSTNVDAGIAPTPYRLNTYRYVGNNPMIRTDPTGNIDSQLMMTGALAMAVGAIGVAALATVAAPVTVGAGLLYAVGVVSSATSAGFGFVELTMGVLSNGSDTQKAHLRTQMNGARELVELASGKTSTIAGVGVRVGAEKVGLDNQTARTLEDLTKSAVDIGKGVKGFGTNSALKDLKQGIDVVKGTYGAMSTLTNAGSGAGSSGQVSSGDKLQGAIMNNANPNPDR